MNASSSASDRYTPVAIALHWLVALGIFCVLPLGVYMHELDPSPQKIQLYAYHKWLGMSILILVIVRLLWRFTHRPPALPDTMSAKEQRIAHGMTHGMYLFMVLSPLCGWLMSSAFGKPVVLFGALPIPDLIGPNESTGNVFKVLHEICNYILCTLFSLHILASLKHHFKDRDDILARMLPFLSKNK